jgi:hypothetical protein
VSKIEELIAAGDDIAVNAAIRCLSGSFEILGWLLPDWMNTYAERRKYREWGLFGEVVVLESAGRGWIIGDQSISNNGKMREFLYQWVVAHALEAGIVVSP